MGQTRFPQRARRPDYARLASRRIPSAIHIRSWVCLPTDFAAAMCFAAAICSGAERREIGDLARA